jgi:hypothetical protein
LSVPGPIKDIGCPVKNIEILGQFHNAVIHAGSRLSGIAKK